MIEKRKVIIGTTAVAFAIGAFAIYTMSKAGAFRDIDPHLPGECRKVEDIVGGEDLQWHPDGEHVYVAAQDRRALGSPGHIYRLRPADPKAVPVDITPELDIPFHPHGLHLYVGEDGLERLFVVNHHNGMTAPHSIEVFDVTDDGSLEHVESITSEALVSPNDVVAVGPDQFYVTNDHGSSELWMHTIEDFLQLARGNVVFYDGEDFREVYGGTQYANGINVSPDGTELYLAETIAKTIKIFKRDPATNDLERKHTVETNMGVDNIGVTPANTLWVAGHPNLLAFLSHAGDPESRSPSEVIRLERAGPENWNVEEIYLDDGDPISGAAVGTARDDTLVIGPVFDPHLVVCEMGGE
ncbi:strictosidine synthase family protein [Persicimonas caeni]|nr:SMP-30/gluconolactonase/LRE family protein [Persicimonas caeni]